MDRNNPGRSLPQVDRPAGQVCTFYSFKGGVGRSMALANVATLLSRFGRSVLVIDWDLEAPGLEKYFGRHLRGSRLRQEGLVELVQAYADNEPLDWRSCLLTAAIPDGRPISVLHAGRDDAQYATRLRALDWERLFREKDLGRYLDRLRDEWIAEYDFVLIDSRTGYTDIGGICSILLPEYLICLFTTNDQSLAGVKETMVLARKAHAELPLDRRRLIVIPVPARDESNTEYQLASEWRKRFAAELSEFYADWIPKNETADRVLDYLKIPYVAYWSFGEKLPVIEEDADNPKKLAFSYRIIARLLHSKLNWSEVQDGRAAAEAEAVQRAEADKRAAEAARIRDEAQQRDAKIEQEHYAQALAHVEDRYRILSGRESRRAQVRGWVFGTISFGAAIMWLFTSGALLDLTSSYRYRTSSDFVMPLASFIAALIVTGLAYVAWRRHLRAQHRLALLEREKAAFDVARGPYSDVPVQTALRLFAERIEDVAAHTQLASTTILPAAAPTSMSTNDTPQRRAPAAIESTSHVVGTTPSDTNLTDPTATSAPADVGVVFANSPLMKAWMREFLPLFTSWLSEYAGFQPRIREIPLDQFGEMPRQIVDSTVSAAVLVLSRAVIEADRRSQTLTEVGHHAGQLFAVTLDRHLEIPSSILRIPISDFSRYAVVGEGFAKSERYVEFQDEVRELAAKVAATIRDRVPA
jgi:cellulose biosynthesis protein BcsQ